jgi:hypothetical protein
VRYLERELTAIGLESSRETFALSPSVVGRWCIYRRRQSINKGGFQVATMDRSKTRP